MKSSVLAGSRSEQSASLPGRPPPVRALLRTVSRALRAASRARAAINDLSMTRLATGGFASKNVINKHLVLFRAQNNWPGMDHLFVFADLFDKFFDAVLVEKTLVFFGSFVFQYDFKPGIQESQFAQAVGQDVKFELRCEGENCR